MAAQSHLTIHPADPPPAIPPDVCPMHRMVGLNFATQLRSSETAFSDCVGPLSIKCAFGGSEVYEFGGGRLTVDDGSYLVLNRGRQYSSAIETESAMESFCIWFRDDFAAQVLAGLRTPHDRLLDDPQAGSAVPVLFFERLAPHDDTVSPVLRRIRSAVRHAPVERAWLEEQFHLLLERLLHAQRGVYREVESLPAARQATRVEIYRRLTYARDYLASTLDRPVQLAEAASIASLSPHHFLRHFKHAFRESPRQFQTRLRMEKAREMVTRTEQPITRICYDLGFESLGSFSSLFRKMYGDSPQHLRQALRASRRAHHSPPDRSRTSRD